MVFFPPVTPQSSTQLPAAEVRVITHSPITIATVVDSVVQGHPAQVRDVRPPLESEIPDIPDWAKQDVADWLAGTRELVVNRENSQHYLNAVKLFDLTGNNKSTYWLRKECLSHSDRMTTVEAFSYRLHSECFNKYNPDGSYNIIKNLALTKEAEEKLAFIPEWQQVQRSIAEEVCATISSFSDQLGFNAPHFILFTGTFGSGKSHQTKQHRHTEKLKLDPSSAFNGVLSSDSVKKVYLQKIPGLTNEQVHNEGCAIRLQLMLALLQRRPELSIVQEAVLSTPKNVAETLDQVLANSSTKIKIVFTDTTLEDSLFGILSRAPGEAIPPFGAIVSSQLNVRKSREALQERIANEPRIVEYEFLYREKQSTQVVAKKEDGRFSQEAGFEHLFEPTDPAIVEALRTKAITEEDVRTYGEPIRKFIGMTIEHALQHLAKLPADERKFTILFRGDFHSHLEPTLSPYAKSPLGGAVRMAACIEQYRKTHPFPLFVVDAGDFLQGTLSYQLDKGSSDITLMNEAGFDIVTVGNHDLDDGLPHLQSLLEGGAFKKVCANITQDGIPCFTPYTIQEIAGLKVGVVGIMGSDAWLSIRPSSKKELELVEPSQVLARLLPELRPQVDVLILLSHSGIKSDRLLADLHPELDIIIGGHTHTYMPQHELHNRKITIFHAAAHGHLLGRIDVAVKESKVFTESSVELLDERFDIGPCAIKEMVAASKSRVEDAYKEVLLEVREPLSSVAKREKITPLGTAVCQVLMKQGIAHAAVINSGSIKRGIDAGPLTVKDVHEILPHKEALWVVEMKGSLWLELMHEAERRFDPSFERQYQYAGATDNINPEALYKIACPSFFYERELADPSLQDRIHHIDVQEEDLRIGFCRILRESGLP